MAAWVSCGKSCENDGDDGSLMSMKWGILGFTKDRFCLTFNKLIIFIWNSNYKSYAKI